MSNTEKLVTLYINGIAYQVPAGRNLVDVAKFYAGDDIPVFCYHPKMNPVGMCRMCLVKMGNVVRNRDTGETQYNADGTPQIQWFPKLQTACTETVRDGMAIITNTAEVGAARDDIIEFLLTSHPLDCPICDKGGECPLQNLTLRHGPGRSVFHFSDKMHLAKHVPLGELIYLDRERCIQCARCTRFCEEYVGDDVLAFHQRGRALQIVTISDPPFDTKFSGNTTDICPVGALTTADFRFGARPWELKEVPSIDPYGPEGANISLSTRLDRDAGGITIIKRIMPRQNELVNEIWISDKTRFGHHHTRAEDRLQKPLVRVGKNLIESTWEHAVEVIQGKLKSASSVAAIAGADQSNEDLWELRKLVETKGQGALGVWPALMSGANVVKQVGIASGSNLASLQRGDVILVVASDLEEEAPIWWLRTKVARDRGVTVIVVNARPTKLTRYAAYNLSYEYGDAAGAINGLAGKLISDKLTNKETLARTDGVKDLEGSFKKGKKGRVATNEPVAAIEVLAKAQNLVVFCGAEGLNVAQHADLMQACANLLILTGHVGRPNNGLIPVWPGANVQGAMDLGYSAEATLDLLKAQPDVLIVAGCDPLGEVADAAPLENAKFVVVTSQFETATTAIADVVLPRQSFVEREGTFTSGERRVQRFYIGQSPIGSSLPDWKIFAQLRSTLDGSQPKSSASAVMLEITRSVPEYADMTYKNLAKVERQFPDVGGEDLYYGGTAYQNDGGMGLQWAVTAEDSAARLSVAPVNAERSTSAGLVVIPTTLLYDRGTLFRRSELMHGRVPTPYAAFNPADANERGVADGELVAITVNGSRSTVRAVVTADVPAGAVLLPRHLNETPGPLAPASLEAIEKVAEAVTA